MATQNNGPSAEFTKGKQKVAITDKNGVQTTRWMSIDDTEAPDAEQFSAHLTDKSVLTKEKVASKDGPVAFDKKNMTISSVAGAKDLAKRLEEDPEAILDEDVQRQVADALTVTSAKKNGEDAYREYLRDEIIAEFSDEEIKEKVEFPGSEGGIWAYVEERTMRFEPSLVELPDEKRNLYTERRQSSAEMKRRFPESYDAIAECTGGAYVVPNHESEAYATLKEESRAAAEKASVKRMGGKPEEASLNQLIDEYRRASRRCEENDQHHQRLRSAITEAAAPDIEEHKGSHPKAAKAYIEGRLGSSTASNPATGTSFTVSANQTHKTKNFIAEREAYHAGRMDPEKAAKQAKRDAARCEIDAISAAKMKKSNDPEVKAQYDGARRIVRDLWTRTRKDGK